MNIGYVIGSLARAGAELQLMQLAAGMHARGHTVRVLAYDAASALDDDLRSTGVELTIGGVKSKREKLRLVRRWLVEGNFTVVHAFLNHVAGLTLLARLPSRNPPVVATDFSAATYASERRGAWLALMLYALADGVVTETETNRRSLYRIAPWLRHKTRLIRNGLALDRFSLARQRTSEPDTPFVFCVVGSVYYVKNPIRIIDAVAELTRRGYEDFRVDWYGRTGLGSVGVGDPGAISYAKSRDVSRYIAFHGEISDIERAYRRADALLHVSLREGFPNAVAEAMACGLPLVVSRVSDLPLVIEDAANGYVVDETDTGAIADGMEKMLNTSPEERSAMGLRSRALAVRWFALDRYLDEFERLYQGLRRRSHWCR